MLSEKIVVKAIEKNVIDIPYKIIAQKNVTDDAPAINFMKTNAIVTKIEMRTVKIN